MTRQLTYAAALREAQMQCLDADPAVWVMGLGVPDPKGVFGSTAGLAEAHPDRVIDIPLSENAVTGACVGMALNGLRPILTHQRVDFALLALEPLINQASKWRYMFGGAAPAVPMVVRMVIGRGWGQGPQHSQSLQALFAHIPGLKVTMPATARDAKGMLIAAVRDESPVVMLEHRWLYGIEDVVPEEMYEVPIGEAVVRREGKDVTLVAVSYMVPEALRAADMLTGLGVDAEIVDLRTLRPLDRDTVTRSVAKTGRLVVADTGHGAYGLVSEVVASVCEAGVALTAPPETVALPDYPMPTSPVLAEHYFPRAAEIAGATCRALGKAPLPAWKLGQYAGWGDQPDPSFVGPF